MIPVSEYKEECGILFVTMDQIGEHHTLSEISDFRKWMSGQTCMVTKDGRSGIYVCDYERWVRQGKKRQQGADWD